MLHARGVDIWGGSFAERNTTAEIGLFALDDDRIDARIRCVLIRVVSIKVFFLPFEFIGRCASAVLQ
jgi:hypothetical protein